MTIESSVISEARTVRYESQPGNCSRYVILATPVRDVECGTLGSVSDGWLIVCGNGRSYLFGVDGYLSTEYVQEKFGLRDADAEHVANLVRKATGRPGRPAMLKAV